MTTGANRLPTYAYDSSQGVNPDTEFPVTPGRSYHVYAITVFLGVTWYYIQDDDDLAWPTWVPAGVFEVLDGRFPPSWRLGYFRFAPNDEYPLISFPEWASDHQFYERLVDGDPKTLQIYVHRRAEVDQAF